MNKEIISPILLSLRVATVATFFTLIVGVFLSWLFARKKFPGKDVIEALILLPMVLPPSVVGYLLLIFFGKRGPMGIFLENTFGFSVIFTWIACTIGSFVVSLPLMYQNCKSAFTSVDTRYEDAARTLGASGWRIFTKVTVPLAWPGIVSGFILSFARALGEFGATMMIAGNIPGKTQTIPIAIYFAVEIGDTRKANILMGIVLTFGYILIFSLNKWLKTKRMN
ncbi:MAG: molybdate ABC transporter permease subunit [Tissierellia bacterium]|nr:molybdate ABC transporter permease subunit [Tissierellia bacterium]